MTFHVPEQCRVTLEICRKYDIDVRLASDHREGNNGAFIFNAPVTGRKIAEPRRRTKLFCIASDGEGWEHVSVSVILRGMHRRIGRCPVWEEMTYVAGRFWDPEDALVQFRPPADQYVNCHETCLHWWRPTGATLPLPDPLMVGPVTAEVKVKQPVPAW